MIVKDNNTEVIIYHDGCAYFILLYDGHLLHNEWKNIIRRNHHFEIII